MSGLAELGLDPRLLVTRARRRRRHRVADRRRRAGLRCAGRRRAGSLGRGAAARSRRQPQADTWPRRPPASPPCCCGWRRSRSPRPRRRDGSCARRIRRRLRSLRVAWGAPVFDAQLVRNRHGPVGRWIMEWKCDECLFSKPAAYPQPVAAAPAHRPHQAPARARQRRAANACSQRSSSVASHDQSGRTHDRPASSSPSKTTRCRFTRSTMRRRGSALRSACRWPMPAPSVRDLQVYDADEAADAKTLNDIADWCDRFTPLVALDPPHGLFLDITGCAHLFGGEAAMMQTGVRRADRAGLCRQRRHRRHVGLRADADAVMSMAASSRDGEEADAVRPLPVSALGADDAITRGLRRAGLKTIGDVASRARHEITARFGAGFTTPAGTGAGAGRCADQPAQTAAGLHRREALCRAGRDRRR